MAKTKTTEKAAAVKKTAKKASVEKSVTPTAKKAAEKPAAKRAGAKAGEKAPAKKTSAKSTVKDSAKTAVKEPAKKAISKAPVRAAAKTSAAKPVSETTAKKTSAKAGVKPATKASAKMQTAKAVSESVRAKTSAAEKPSTNGTTVSAKPTESAEVRKAVDTIVSSKPTFDDTPVSVHAAERKNATEKVSFDGASAGSKSVSEAVAESESEKKLNKKIVIAIICAAVIIALIAVFLNKSGAIGSNTGVKDDALASVQLYMDSGDYDRAQDILEKLLKKNPSDAEARRLLDELTALKSAKSADGVMQDDLARRTAEAQKTQRELEELLSRGKGQDSGASSNTEAGAAQRTDGRDGAAQTLTDQSTRSSADRSAAQPSSDKTAAQRARDAEEAARREKEAAAERERKAKIAAQKEAEAALERERKAEAEKAAKALAAQKQKEEAARKAAEEELARKNRAIQKEIDGVNAEIAQGKSDLTANKIDSALNHFGKAQKMLPISAGEPLFSGSKNSEMASALYDASQSSSSNADKKRLRDAAVGYAEEAVRKTPNDAASHYVLGMAAFDTKNYPKALEELSKAVQNDRSNALYHYNLGRAQYLSRRYSDARSSFQRSVDLDGRFAPAQYNLGLANLRTGNEAEALSSFRRARTTDANYEKAYLEEARLLSKQGDKNGAVSAYNNVLRINDVNGNALRELGSEYYAMENYAASENCYRRALALLSPTEEDPTTYYNLSATLYAERKDAEAITYAKRAYASKSSLGNAAQANVVYNYALMLQEAGKSEEAIPLYVEALRLNQNHEKSKINLGKMYLEMNPPDVDTALQLFRQAYNSDNKSFEANNNLGSAYLAKRDYKNAIQFYQNALRLDPSNNTVRSNLAQTYASDGQFDNAKTTYTELIKRDGRNWDAYVELGKVCMSTGDTAGAERYLSEVQTKQPNHRRAEVTELLSALRNGGAQTR